MWASGCAYLSAFRDILGLKLPEHENFAFWEEAAREGGFRVMHEEFCIVSDFPEFIKMDEDNQPHCDNGPSHRWRDGWELFHWHGTAIHGEWVKGEFPPLSELLNWPNVDQRRAGCEMIGWDKVLEASELNPVVLDQDEPYIGTLIQVDLPDAPKQRFIKYQCGTGRWFVEAVNDPQYDTALKANAGGAGWRPESGENPDNFIAFIGT